MKCAFADDERELRLVVERRDSMWAHDRRVVADHDRIQFDESCRFLRDFLDQLVPNQFFEMRFVVLADAEEQMWIGNGRQKADLIAPQAYAVAVVHARCSIEGASCCREA